MEGSSRSSVNKLLASVKVCPLLTSGNCAVHAAQVPEEFFCGVLHKEFFLIGGKGAVSPSKLMVLRAGIFKSIVEGENGV